MGQIKIDKRSWFCVALLLATLSIKAQSDTAFKTPYYRQKTAYFSQIAPPKNHIVFLGNSITEVGEWQELLPTYHVLNRGISGDVTQGVLARINDFAKTKPVKIFIMIGINDLKIGKPIAYITANQLAIIKKIQKITPKTKIIMQSTLPVNEGMLASIYKRLNNRDIELMNKALQQVCEQAGVTYINLHPALADESGQLKKERSTDGLHLKSIAYIRWVALLKKNKLI